MEPQNLRHLKLDYTEASRGNEKRSEKEQKVRQKQRENAEELWSNLSSSLPSNSFYILSIFWLNSLCPLGHF